MLSQDIRQLAEWYEQYRTKGVFLEPGYVTAVIAVLNGLHAEARIIELQAMPPPALAVGDTLPPNVVRFTPRSAA